jgi:predicted Fe-S protein YdhL (DUF1289 family)
MPEITPTSPCVRSCCLDKNDICLGCGRHLGEITGWQSASNDKKREIIAMATKRLETHSTMLRDLLK